MLLSAFSVENYRAFARRQDIEIRPLTLFFGWNSGGKSALVRFLPLLAESVQVGGPPIWLAGEVGRGATWPELVCRSTERPLLRFGLRWAGRSRGPSVADIPPMTAEWEVNGDLAGRWQETVSLSLGIDSEACSFSVSQVRRQSGLIPRLEPDDPWDHNLDVLEAHLGQLASEIQWISGVRVRPPRVATYGGGASPILRPDGGNAVEHLIAAQQQSTVAPLMEATQKFFAGLGEQLVLDNPMEGAWRLLLHPAGAPRVRVNLCDTGEGYTQVLPVLVALARARAGGPHLLCLEQPELHLHTRAQAALASLLVETAKTVPRTSLLVETHSEVLLTSIQLAIARGEITPGMVRTYWVESRPDGTSDAVPVDFDDQGRPTSTAMIGAFDEAIRLGQELVMMQMPKRPS